MVSGSNNLSVKYHDIFDYKLTKAEAVKWQYKNQKIIVSGVKNKGRLQREKYSQKKLVIAKKVAKLISKIPTVLFVGITGSLAMMNAKKKSDIDLILITKNGTLWTTRLLVYILLLLTRYQIRIPRQNLEKDKLCLNMWLDETDLVWSRNDRNIYTAHEIAQIVSLVNKNKTYEKFLHLNRWILLYWSNAVKIKNIKRSIKKKKKGIWSTLIESLLYKLQLAYMKDKMTREVVGTKRAFFHPHNNSSFILNKLK